MFQLNNVPTLEIRQVETPVENFAQLLRQKTDYNRNSLIFSNECIL